MTSRVGLFQALDLMILPSPSVQSAIQAQLKELVELRNKRAFPDVDFVAAVLVSYFRNTNGSRWMTRRPEPADSHECQWWKALRWDWTERERRSWTGAPSLASWLGRSSLLGVPLAALRALGAWDAGTFRVQMLLHVPTPLEVLRFQAQGVRPVTLLMDPERLWTSVERFPNAFELTVHDLIHAERFQRDQAVMVSQVGFFLLLQDLVSSSTINSLLESDPELKREFEYVLSDMNTVPVHGLQYLKAILIRHYLRRGGRSVSEFLGVEEKQVFDRDFLKLIQVWRVDKATEQALMRMCSSAYQPDVDGPRIHNMAVRYHQNRADLGSFPAR